MSANPNKLSQFWQELKRRNVVRVVTVYAGAAFVIIELINNITEPLHLPEWTPTLVIVLLAIGFPIVIIFSWIYDAHPDGGLVKTKPAKKVKVEEITRSSSGWKIASYISFVVIVGLIVLNIIPREGKNEILDKSIAVLPFINDSPYEEKMYFINGTMEAILDNLCKIEDLRVPGRTSVEQYRNNPKPIPIVAEEMNVSYVLEGSGHRDGENVRLFVQLREGKTDKSIWSKAYDADIEEIFSLESEIAQLIASEINAVITPEEKQRIERIPTNSLTAYDYYLQGSNEQWKYWEDHDPSHIHRSIDLSLKAVELDPNFSMAYLGMGRGYWMLGSGDIKPSQDHWEESKRLIQKAIELDPSNGLAYAELGVVQHNWDWDSTAARKSFERAIQLSPKIDQIYSHYMHFEHRLRNCSRLKMLIEKRKENCSVEIDEEDLWNLLWLECQDDLKEIERIGEQYWTENSDMYHTILYYIAYIQDGHIEKASEIAESIISRTKDPSIQLMLKGYHFAATGKLEDAYAKIEDLTILSESRFVSNIYFANIFYALGDREQTLKYMELALKDRDWRIHAFRSHSSLNLIKPEPWLQDIIDRSWIPLNDY